MREYYYNFLLMLQFMTRIPINKSLPCERENFKSGANFFWLIGLLIGGGQYLLYMLLIKIMPVSLTAIVIIIFDILITGALHIDGFGDTCDGFFAFKGGKDKIIEIMKDSRIGTFACISIILNILIKYQGYIILLQKKSPLLLILIPIISRFSITLLSLIGKPAKEKGSGNLFIDNVSVKEVLVNIIFAAAVGLALGLIYDTVILFITAVIITFIFNYLCKCKINGVTGDSLGANNELVVLMSLMALSLT
ncbi:adenosylcobinamide-GDP ribazoletransferase [Clostridium sp. 19966]|uniref:adenosylcobinamide-GDP ribazoletransferase n=1 Tax=Clostridium sp. 19966 TaxID=2768166 RepID=UPI0028DF27CB|nr:adenosylcobinamide-GDP ribazoletransferase [Clostridium sp. 19966]MDT8717353.1 adenosylcobinamide-GDP ribazoletransferase [Clostridium sp. 19966]